MRIWSKLARVDSPAIDEGISMEHPVIGAWTVEFEGPRGVRSDYATASFHPEGTLTITISGYTAHGAWRSTDSGAVHFRALAPMGPGEGQTGWHTLTFEAHVGTDGNALSLDGTYARPTPSGAPTVTTVTGSGQRLVIEQA